MQFILWAVGTVTVFININVIKFYAWDDYMKEVWLSLTYAIQTTVIC